MAPRAAVSVTRSARTTAEVKVRSDRALAVPLLRFLGASLAHGPDGFWGIELQWGPNSLNAVDALHGGVIATVLDVAAYLAVLPQLTAAEEAVTIAFAAQYSRPPARRSCCCMRAGASRVARGG